ncbi:hypothetical protein LZD49_02735 [Dyadobacter sp. CY261]|uniref:hypothetical protein n=1 Tax=Dyadobacter sp. CY261 TaxID=2907203 RepID=UPI001F15B332|nr:hypothetical protein [Dyadobacter sp. CY261]MCF0069368.1 hypothetical protein [Dyadobacter sp. CY261]
MTEYLPTKPKNFTTDLADHPEGEKSLHMPVSARNIHKLQNLGIENLWLIGANEKDLRKILSLVSLKYLNLYQVLAKELTILETQNLCETIILNWNTKATALWDISKNINLNSLEIIDFSKIDDINQLSLATQIRSLSVGGGHNKPLKIQTLEPIARLVNLTYLCLTNLKVVDDTLRPIGKLKNLDRLDLSNQFETSEYAWLATRLPNTDCKMFNAANPCTIVNADNEIVWDTMITGRRKPFLLSTEDEAKIQRYRHEFERLKIAFG